MEALRNEIVIEGTGIFIPEDNIAKGNDAFTIHLLLITFKNQFI